MKKLFLLAILAFSLNGFSQVPPYVPTLGLVAYYPLDANGNDLSGNGNTLISFGTPVYISNTPCPPDSACHLPNGNDYFETPSTSWSLINNFPQGTVSFWIMLDSQYVSGHYFGIDNSFMMKQKYGVGEDMFFGIQSGTTKVRMQVTGVFPASAGMDVIGSTTLSFNTWYHVVGVWNGVTHTLYINGNMDGQISNSSGISNRPTPDYFSIGSGIVGGNGTTTFPSGAYGKMNDVGFWNRALNSTEITTLFQGCNNVGINDNDSKIDFSIFPNPTTDKITIKTSYNSNDLSYIIYDQIGRQIVSGRIEKQTTTADISKLEAGIYFLQINGQNKQTFKIIKN